MKLDILAFGAHPDDVELGAGGTLALQAKRGQKTGIIDLTRGEMGTRGTPEKRTEEAAKAAKILGCAVRENLDMRDGFITNSEPYQMAVITAIRKYQPEVVLYNAHTDRHPDHGNASTLVREACFKAGLEKIETTLNGVKQQRWRPKTAYQYIQYYSLQPDFIVDISASFTTKMESILAHDSQFYQENSTESTTVIASKNFFKSIEGRAREYGQRIYTEYGEGFLAERTLGISNISDLI